MGAVEQWGQHAEVPFTAEEQKKIQMPAHKNQESGEIRQEENA